MRRLQTEPVSPDELARAKNQLVATALQERETNEGQAFEIGYALMVEGDAARSNTDVGGLEAVTVADVQRVAKTYLRDDRRVVVRYLDDSRRPGDEKPAPDLAEFSPHVDAEVLPAGVLAPPPPERLPHTAPTPSAPLMTTAPKIAERTLANGLRVIVAKTSDIPLVTAELTVTSGGAADPPGLSGLAALTTDLLAKGTTTRSATEIAAEIEAAGGSLKSETTYDGSSLTLTVLADQLGVTLPILADVTRRPAFASQELERLRRQKLDDLALLLKQPGDLAALAAPVLVFGPHSPYGHPLGGTPASLAGMSRPAVLHAYAGAFRPDDAILVLTGDIDAEHGFALAARAFGDWSKPSTPRIATPAVVPAPKHNPSVVVIDLPAAGQAAVVLAGETIGRNDGRYYGVRAINAVLGGGYSARLNEEVRIKRGLSYGAFSEIEARKGIGLFSAEAQTKNAAAAEVAALVLDTAKTLGDAPIPPAELAARKASLVGQYGRVIDTSAGMAAVLTSDALYGVDLAAVGRYSEDVESIDAAKAQAAAHLAVDPAAASLILVGDAKAFIRPLRQRFPDAQVVEASSLDLDSVTLRHGK